ncbi:uncharacterized protein LOC111043756 isoform X2 [Nilaparvata lugens]|uniref:uncharacterized protein LOC111043756 isoform X2 n=1 Tax=Nilaparvata lugens TaxID=108931 RepID=UPI00193D864A|nr:uncharacterized protein LOC111043756 isoform X2 [Nilaparvata lugens]
MHSLVDAQFLAIIMVLGVCHLVVGGVTQPSLHVSIQPVGHDDVIAEDVVSKHFEASPDVHTNKAGKYRQTIHTQDHVISAEGDTVDATTDVLSQDTTTQQQHVMHRKDTTEETTNSDTGKYTNVKVLKQLTGRGKSSTVQQEQEIGDYAIESKNVLTTADGTGVVTDEAEKELNKITLSHTKAHVQHDNIVADVEQDLRHASLAQQERTSTVHVHNNNKHNIIAVGDQDIDRDTLDADFADTHHTVRKNTSSGEILVKSYDAESNIENTLSHEHGTGVYHETPQHKFKMVDKQIDRHLQGRYTLTQDKQFEYKGADGSTDDMEEKRRQELKHDMDEHTDTVTVKTVSKQHPGTPLTVTLSTNIVDRDHYTLQQTASGVAHHKLANGGTRTVHVEEERTNTYNMDTIPRRLK